MEGWVWNGIGHRDPTSPNAYKHREIHIGPLYAQILSDGTVLDVIVKANEAHFVPWFKGGPFDVDAFLQMRTGCVLNPPAERKRKYYMLDRDFENSTAGTKTSDYVSRIDVLKLIVAVNNRWNWDNSPDALRCLVIPQWRPRTKVAFHLVEEFDVDEHVEIKKK